MPSQDNYAQTPGPSPMEPPVPNKITVDASIPIDGVQALVLALREKGYVVVTWKTLALLGLIALLALGFTSWAAATKALSDDQGIRARDSLIAAETEAQGILTGLRNAVDGVGTGQVLRIGNLQVCWGQVIADGTLYTNKHRSAHFKFPQTFAAAPIVLYSVNAQKPNSGKHYGPAAVWGVYSHDERVDGCQVTAYVTLERKAPTDGSNQYPDAVMVSYIAIGQPSAPQ